MFVQENYGWCKWSFEEDYVHIYDLYILTNCRRQGKAKELLLKTIKIIRDTGWTKPIQIVADPLTQDISKEKLKSFYESLGLLVFDYYGY